MSKICPFIIFILILLLVFNFFLQLSSNYKFIGDGKFAKRNLLFSHIMINYQMINRCKEIEDLLPHMLLSVSKVHTLKSVKLN